MICPVYSAVSRVSMAALNLWLPAFFNPANKHHFNRTLPLERAFTDLLVTTGQTVPLLTLLEAMHFYAIESGYLELNPAAVGSLPPCDRHPYRTLFTRNEDGEKVLAFHMQTDSVIFPTLKQSINQNKKGNNL